MTRYLAAVAVVVLVAWRVAAQVPSPNLQAGEPFRVEATHVVKWYAADGQSVCIQIPPAQSCVPDTANLEVLVDGTVAQSQPISALINDVIAFQFPNGLSAGAHNVVVRAVGSGGTTAAAPVSFTVDPAPPAPTPAPGLQGPPAVTFVTPPTGTSITLTRVVNWTTNAAGTTVTSPAFTAAADDVLVVAAASDANGATPACSMASVPALTWTNRAGGGTATSATARLYTARVVTATTVTATLTCTNSPVRALAVYRATGVDPVTPVGATWTATSSTNNWTASTYVSTVANSRGVALAVDYAGLGTPTSTDVGNGADYSATAQLSYVTAMKAAATSTVGTAVTFNFDAPTGTPVWRGAALELRPR